MSRPSLACGEGVACVERGRCLFPGVSMGLAGAAMSCDDASVVNDELELEVAELDAGGEATVGVNCGTWSS